MKDMQIAKLLEQVKNGTPRIRREVETAQFTIYTHDDSSIVFLADSIGVTTIDNRALADAILERCRHAMNGEAIKTPAPQ